MKLYHATSAAQAILADGFRDWSGSYGLADAVEGTALILTGVFISDRPLSANDGAPVNWGDAPGDGVFEVTIPDDVDFDDYELIEEGLDFLAQVAGEVRAVRRLGSRRIVPLSGLRLRRLGASARRPRRPEFRPSHLSYALRASGHVLRPAARLAPRGATPKSRFPCAGGR